MASWSIGWAGWLLLAAALHAGFQLTVTLVVYPALAEVSPAEWVAKQRAHSWRIAWLVAPIYGLLLVGCALALAGGGLSVPIVVAVLGAVGSFAATAFVAAPTHQKLGHGRDEALVARLLVADRVRCVSALVGLLGAIFA